MKAIRFALFSSILSLIILAGSCSDLKTNDQVFMMRNNYYMLEKGVTKEIYLSEHNQDGYNITEKDNFSQIMTYTIDRSRSILELTPKSTGETALTVQVLGPDSTNHYYLTFNVFAENKLILYPYSYNSLNKTVIIEKDDVSVQFFINGEEEFTATSSNETVAVAEIHDRKEPKAKTTRSDITPPAQVLPEGEINPDYQLVIKAMTVGETDIFVSDKNGKTETIKVKVQEK